ncbi:AAA family ATPase [Saccharothrix sp. BKS2]|uniref:AAA family ATPase n=1 Tax=Saccharothrix sp. BKS2 TaxID=3064400 RepID=UPI0039ED1EE6
MRDRPPAVFVGRRAQLGALASARADSTRDGLVTCVVTGEPGMGRTALLDAFATDSLARGNAAVRLSGRWRDRRGPAALVDDLLRDLAELCPDEVARRLRAAWHDARATGAEPTCGLVAAVREAVVASAGGSCLVVTVDDLDQAGTGGPALLHRVLAACSDLPVLLVASLRPGAVVPELGELLYGARRVALGGLSRSEAGQLFEARTGARRPDGLVAECHWLSAGNPLLLVGLAAWVAAGPEGTRTPLEVRAAVLPQVVQRVLDWVDRVDSDAGGLVEVLALVDRHRGTDTSVLVRLSGLDQHRALDALDVLARMGIVTDDDAVVLRHPLLRNTVAAATTLVARNAVHLAAAAHLHERGAPADRVADHLVASTVPPTGNWSAGVLLRAARAADRDEDAVRYLEAAVRAASGDERGHACLELVDTRLRLDRAAGLDLAVAALGQAPDEPTRRGLLARIAGTLQVGDTEEDVLRRVAVAVTGTESQGWSDLHRLLSAVLDSPPATAVELAERFLADADPGVEPHPAVVAVSALCLHLLDRDPDEALRRAHRVLDRELDELTPHPVALIAVLAVLVEGGQREEARACVRRLRQLVPRPSTALRAGLALVAGRIAVSDGDLDTARRRLADGLDALPVRTAGALAPVRANLVALAADVWLSRGDRERAAAVLEHHGYAGALRPAWYHREVLLVRARLRIAEGDPPRARRDLAELHALNEALELPRVGSLLWRLHGVALLDALGSAEEAARAAAEQVSHAEDAGSPQERGRALRVWGWVRGGAEGERLLREGIALLQQAPGGWEPARAYCDLGRLLTRAGRHQDAVTALTEAVRRAEHCGAVALGEQARRHLRAAGGHAVQHVPLRGVVALTRREREILLDAVRGLTNKAIAAARRITRRTVELHLSSAYRKLDITGRDDLPDVLGHPGVWELLTDGAAAGGVAPGGVDLGVADLGVAVRVSRPRP